MTVGASLPSRRAPALAAMLAALVLGALASAAEPLGLRVVALLERLAVLVCMAVAVVGGVGAILTGINGDTPRAVAFFTLLVVAMLLLVGLALRVDDKDEGLDDIAPPAAVRPTAGPEGIVVLMCIAASIAGGAGAILGAFYDHPLRALGFAGLLLVAVGLLVRLALRGRDMEDRR